MVAVLRRLARHAALAVCLWQRLSLVCLWRRGLLAGLCLSALLLGCGDDELATRAATPTASVAGTSQGPLAGGVVLPPEHRPEPNPLGLPSQTIEVAEGARVFTVPEPMLRNAKLGSAMQLHSAKVLGREGELVNVRIGTGKPYLVHPAYVVVPRPGRLRRGGPVFAAYGGKLKHGVLRRMAPRGAVIRYTDLGYRLSDQTIPRERVGILPGKLAPGAYAVMRGEHAYEHVTLVSGGGGKDSRWFVLGRDGQTRRVPEAQLTVLPKARARFRAGDEVLVAWHGSMVAAKIRSIDHPSLFIVQRRRAGGTVVAGPGMIMRAAGP